MPSAQPLQQTDRTYVLSGRQRLVYFGGCDYFRLSTHPVIMRGVERGLQRFGLNVAASRMTTGNHHLYERLEKELANYFDVPAAVLFSSGYASNLATAEALAGRFSHLFLDERAHASLQDAAKLLGGRSAVFRHRDPAHLHRLVRGTGSAARIAVLTDGLFAHSGAVAPLHQYQKILPRSAWLFVDDAHAAGIIGRHGRGSIEWENLSRRQVVQTITLSKAFGVYGGAVLTDPTVQAAVLERSRYYAGNTPLPLPLAQGALTSVRWLRAHPQLREKLQENVRYVQERLRIAGWEHPEFPGPIISFIPQTAAEAAALSRRLTRAGVHPPLIRYPGGPPRGYFRFALSSAHTREQLDRLIAGLTGGNKT